MYFFIQAFPRELTRTELGKLVYLFDYYHSQLCGTSFTGLVFIRDNYGPYTQEICTELDNMSQDGLIEIDPQTNWMGNTTYYHRQRQVLPIDLPEYAYKIARGLIERTRALNLIGIKNLAYSTPPMVHILARERELGYELNGEVIDMSREKKDIRKTPLKNIRQAFKTINLERRGSDHEYATAILEESEVLRVFRERANACKD